jgi:cation diffusion facilitator family transporter
MMSCFSKGESRGWRKERVALRSVVASGVIAVGKLGAGLGSGSLALLSEAVHSLVDLVSVGVTWFAVRWAGRPADEEHQYGHGKVESVAALVETGVLFALALGVCAQAVRRGCEGGGVVVVSPWVVGVVGVSVVIDWGRIRVLRRVARETGSQALAAGALHFASDLAGSVAVLAGLALVGAGFVYGDVLAAGLVAVFIGVAGWRLGRRALDTLLDTAPAGCAERVRGLVASVGGVVGVDSVRVRSDGCLVFAEVVFGVSRALSLDEVSVLKGRVREVVSGALPGSRLTLMACPRVLDSESVRERVLLAGRRSGLPLHHVTVQEVGGRLSISFDMEVDGRTRLALAHAQAEAFKRTLRGEFGALTEVEPHVEPLDVGLLAGCDAPGEVVARVTGALRDGVAGGGVVGEVHDVRVRATPSGWVVNYHCRADGALSVEVVHRGMDMVEHGVRLVCPEIVRIVGHADVRGGG